MKIVRVVNRSRDVVLAERVFVTDSFLNRGWGLLGRSRLAHGEGMLITSTNLIHSCFMRFRFDAIYLDVHGCVCHVVVDFPPFRFGPLIWRAKEVLELAAGTIAQTDTSAGDVIVFEPVSC